MITNEDISILRHSLGVQFHHDRPYRNYYIASTGDLVLKRLADLELVRLYRRDEHYECYEVTPCGRELALEDIPRLPEKRLRYLRFLKARDAYQCLSFREFLTDPYWKAAREGSE